MSDFFKEFNDFYVQRRFSKIPEPYPKNEIYKDYNSAKKIEITINPGDMLFIPAGWFHYVLSEKVDQKSKMNIATSFFTEYTTGCLDCRDFSNFIFNTSSVIKESVTTIDYNKYIKSSTPFILTDYFKHNKKWDFFNMNNKNIKKFFKNKNVLVTRSNNNHFSSNYIKNIFPNSCIETYMSIDDFYKLGINRENNQNYYLIQSEIKNINIDSIKPIFIQNEPYANFNIWINFGNIYSSLHCDQFNNTLTQIQGSKKIILIPPNERDKLHLINPFNTKFLCSLNKVITNFNKFINS
jgi:hypothetical protein